MAIMSQVWQMMLPWRFSGHLQEDWAWLWGELLATWWRRLPATACLMLSSTKRLQDSWVELNEQFYRHTIDSAHSSIKFIPVCVLCRNKTDRWHRQQMAGNLLFGGGARLSSQRGGQCPTQRQNPVHLRQVHPGHDLRGCSQSLWDCPSKSQTESHQARALSD